MTDPSVHAVNRLAGQTTADGWFVENLVSLASYQSGGNFSTGYTVKHRDGRTGFMKAIDFSKAERARDKMRALQELTTSYNFERDVLDLCRGHNMSKVVTAISNGSIRIDDTFLGEVHYLIFELADGDVRKHIHLNNEFDLVWTLGTLHHIAIGLSQLHSKGIYHQDVKPSNVLVFDEQETSKLADLGRSHCRTIDAPHDILDLPGARSYAPPEQLYAFALPDTQRARAAADLFLMGSMVYFLVMGEMLTPSITDRLRPEHRAPIFARDDAGWRGHFEDVVPYLKLAFGEAIADFKGVAEEKFGRIGEPAMADDLTALLCYLTEPHPAERGHPHEHVEKHGNPYALRRFVSSLSQLAAKAEFRYRLANAKAA
jgi:eukaryotic-like serine/threonine-protein kinase